MRRPRTAGALALALSVTLAGADAVIQTRAMTAPSIAEFFIDAGGVRVELEIGLQDLQAFRNLLPDEIHERLGNPAQPLAERLPLFFARDLSLIADAGPPLPGRVMSMEARQKVRRDEITGEALPAGEEGELVIFAELFYPFDSPPDQLTFGAPVAPPAGVGFVAYHDELPVNDFRYLSRGFVLDLDWDDPWYSRFLQPSLRRSYYAAMSGFIYVEPYEVRKEIIARPLDLQRWVDLGLDGRETIPAEMQPELTRRVAEFLRTHHAVTIDGEQVPAELAQINFLRRSLRNSTVIDPPQELDLVSATLGVIFVYPTDGLPGKVTMEWDLFAERIDVVPVASVDQAGPLPSILTPDAPLLEWTNFLKNPELPTLVPTAAPPGRVARAALALRWLLAAASLGALVWTAVAASRRRALPPVAAVVCVLALGATTGAFLLGNQARLTEPRTRELVSALLHNVYRAFDYRGEEKIYDVLARSVEGDLLTQIYLETRRGLEIRNQGGARAKVKELELTELETRPGEDGGFVADATWNVAGSVGHWGHVHSRTNRYRARLGIAPVGDAWKLIGLELLEEERL